MTLETITAQNRSTPRKESLIGEGLSQVGSGNKDLSATRLKGAVKDLEALFFYEMLKEMRQTTQGGFLGKGMGNDIYSSLFDMEMAKLFAERGLGLGEMILKQIKGREENKPGSLTSPPQDLKLSSMRKETLMISSMDHQTEDSGSKNQNQETTLRLPVDGRISSNFGWRSDPFTGEQKFHAGIDIAAPSGKEIYPINSGRVIFSGATQGYGNTVVIDHGDGCVSKYGHNLTNLVSIGDKVDPGQAIALVGNTGKSTGPHLHFEVQLQGERVNPQDLVRFHQGELG
jgi:murein DD-endopeptidase MepM/ murein hydrolase activator NlpD